MKLMNRCEGRLTLPHPSKENLYDFLNVAGLRLTEQKENIKLPNSNLVLTPAQINTYKNNKTHY